MKSIFKKLNVVSEVHKERINSVVDYYNNETVDSSCRLFYELEFPQISNNLDILSSSSLSPQHIPAIITAANEIENKNNDAEALSCILIY